jgi:Zn-dependent protease with chaperone function
VFWLAALGYAFPALVVFSVLALTTLAAFSVVYLPVFGAVLFALAVAVLLVVLRTIWVRLEPPAGERVTRLEAPALFEMLDDLESKLRTPALYEVVITGHYNAAVMQLSRFGLFGGHRNYLLIGLLLMKGFTVEQFRAVLGHELNHLSPGDDRVSYGINRLRRSYARLKTAYAERPQRGASLIQAFFKWYIPYFDGMSFPLARANEYEADVISAHLTSPAVAAQVLTSLHVMSYFLDQKYWRSMIDGAKESPTPNCGPYSVCLVSAMRSIPAGEWERWQDLALAETSSLDDPHPALCDRLEEMGALAEFAPPAVGEGAEKLLGDSLAPVEQALDAQWREFVAGYWREMHDHAQRTRAALAEWESQVVERTPHEARSLEMVVRE